MESERTRNRRPVVVAAWLVAAAGLMSCGKPERPPVTEVPGYQRLQDEVGDFDFAPLAGRRIVIDPGHGGHFRGAIGLNGLTEAEVNLGVALYLRGLLEWAGAEPHLTRTADYDFLTPADSSLSSDLAARVAISDSLKPDVFLSIHHNSNAELDRDLNETQTYYPVGREGADLDLARSIHKYLVRNLRIEPAKIMAGNFYVLRHATVPAVLGEPSMISNPIIEKRLSLAAKQELEAKAYFLGLLEYFAGGTPRFVSELGDTVTFLREDQRGLTWRFEPGGTPSNTGPPLDPASLVFRVDDRPQRVAVGPEGWRLTWFRPPEFEHGRHQILLRGRNTLGRSTEDCLTIWVGGDPPPEFFGKLIQEAPIDPTAGESRTALFAYGSGGASLDRYENLKVVNQKAPGAGDIELPIYPGERGWLLTAHDAFPPFPAFSFQRDGATEYWPFDLERQALVAGFSWCVVWADPLVWPGQVVPGGSWSWRWTASVADLPARERYLDPTAPVIPLPDGAPLWLEAAGAAPLVLGPDHRGPWADPAGAPPDTLFWHPLLPELVGHRIVIDPTGGGSEVDGAGPLGSRGADLNLRVAEMTAALLRGAGAEVQLTRTDERWVPPEEKVLQANRFSADLFLTIGRSAMGDPPFSARHHHGSGTGTTWANLFARLAAPLTVATGTDTVAVGPSYAYLLRHTACPALQIGLPLPRTLDDEVRLTDPSHQHATARALFAATAALLSGERLLDELLDPGTLLAEHGDRLPPAEQIAWVRLDGNFLWLPPRWGGDQLIPLSLPSTPGLPARGPEHTLEIMAAGSSTLWALRREPDGRQELRNLTDEW